MKSITYGDVSVRRMVEIIRDYIRAEKDDAYEISVGTDSQNTKLTKVVVAVAVHRVGLGGIFFYDTRTVKKITSVRQKIYYETSLSLELAAKLSKAFAAAGIRQEISIHLDIGENRKGRTFELISEIVGWVRASGYRCAIKPDSVTASSIANRYTKR